MTETLLMLFNLSLAGLWCGIATKNFELTGFALGSFLAVLLWVFFIC